MEKEPYIRPGYKPECCQSVGGQRKIQLRLQLLALGCGCALLAMMLTYAEGNSSHQLHLRALRNPAIERPQAIKPLAARPGLPSVSPRDRSIIVARALVGKPKKLADAGSARSAAGGAPNALRPRGDWREIAVKTGDTLSSIFSRLGIYHELQPLMQLGGATKTLNAIFPGQSVHVRVSDRGIEELLFDPDRATRLIVFRNGDGELDATLRKLPLETYEVRASGTIKHSLYIDGASAGLSDLLIMKLAELFGWDIDFALDIRKGDSFVVVYEEHYRDGEKLGDGIILAAEFTNNGQVFRVLRYTDSNGHTDYYSPDGRCIRRSFLRTPVEVARISSPFDLHRKHPILNTIRAHRGVDYAAPLGTPIKATGNGRVVERSTLGGYGLAVVLDHGSKYTTLYGHMSRFAHNIEVGKHVKQGQVIGYVGASGLATGPHLHYEFQINGMHHDPLTVSLPRAKPLAGQEMADYVSETQALHPLLDLRVPGRVVMTMR